MTIIRSLHDKDHPYFVVSFDAVNDDRLSYKAVAILLYLLSKPDNWVVRLEDLAKRHTDGIEAVKSGLKELRKFGYLIKQAIRDEQGKVTRWNSIVIEKPSDLPSVMDMSNVLKNMPYRDYLKTEHWQTVRKAALAAAEYRCQTCNAKVPLDVHHRTYERRGSELPSDVVALCSECHSVFHKRMAVTE